ncbi:RICIN domain-containing protein [Streptomyces sp. rh34]|uniref:RICIN domain-containing protein n=1 Tax=Streptomyces sp. rh34 TaxID=2034272 RepID=UPI000BF2060E|nr:RICIN domain-containing protein [Streptomyces sp. rh34]
MTRSSQQTPASQEARVEPGAESEGTVASAASVGPVGPAAPTVPDEPVAPGPEAPESETSGERKNPEAADTTAAQPGAAAPETRAGTTEAGSGAPDADPAPGLSASAAAQSRLPALVRTMTATAIDRPQPQAGPVGRPGRAVLAGAAVAGALLVSVPFLVLAGNDDEGPEQPSTAAAGTVLDGSGQEAPGEFAVTAPETSPPADGKGDEGKQGKPEKPAGPVRQSSPPAPASGGDEDGAKAKADDAPKNPPEKADSPQTQPEKADGAKNQPAKAAPAVTLSGPVSFRSHLSGRCIDVPGHNFNDGRPLFMWDCNGADAQKWRFASDGTIRIKDKCLDVANANFNDGTPIQIAWCNGADAQKFALNGAHDLVNTAVGKCVDIPNHSRGRGAETYLILWTCTGLDNQKWSV